ncbi:MAG: molybdenum cofactor synthesis protein [Chlorobi bacterium]|nr:molybdenum cofactor synthesis protein [Chlorobiota bacterium]
MNKIKILSVSLAKERGRKYSADEIELSENGVVGDVHRGSGNRQVSIIDVSHIESFRKLTEARKTEAGEFAENIRVSGIGNATIIPFDKFKIGEAELEVTQIGKPFHAEFSELGHYVMPRVGIFCRVSKKGILKAGDVMQYIPKTYKALIITLSDRASRGEYEDRSGPVIKEILKDFFHKKKLPHKIKSEIIPDDGNKLKKLISDAAKEKYDVIITTGGTGIGKRDITVETVQPMLDKEIPGIMEHIRYKYGSIKPNALLSRGVAGTIDESLVYTLPGSVKAVNEYMNEILKTLYHLFFMLHGVDVH